LPKTQVLSAWNTAHHHATAPPLPLELFNTLSPLFLNRDFPGPFSGKSPPTLWSFTFWCLRLNCLSPPSWPLSLHFPPTEYPHYDKELPPDKAPQFAPSFALYLPSEHFSIVSTINSEVGSFSRFPLKDKHKIQKKPWLTTYRNLCKASRPFFTTTTHQPFRVSNRDKMLHRMRRRFLLLSSPPSSRRSRLPFFSRFVNLPVVNDLKLFLFFSGPLMASVPAASLKAQYSTQSFVWKTLLPPLGFLLMKKFQAAKSRTVSDVHVIVLNQRLSFFAPSGPSQIRNTYTQWVSIPKKLFKDVSKSSYPPFSPP